MRPKFSIVVLLLLLLVFVLSVFYLSFKSKKTETDNSNDRPTPGSTSQKLNTPTVNLENNIISSPLTITGTVPAGWMFEGSFPVIIKSSNGIVLAQTTARETVPGSWQTGDIVSFSAKLSFKTNETSGVIILKKDNPSGLPENDITFEIPVKIASKVEASNETLCQENSGKWISEFKECEGIKRNVCEENKGTFNDCDSVCRHETDQNKPCILLCVSVCKF